MRIDSRTDWQGIGVDVFLLDTGSGFQCCPPLLKPQGRRKLRSGALAGFPSPESCGLVHPSPIDAMSEKLREVDRVEVVLQVSTS